MSSNTQNDQELEAGKISLAPVAPHESFTGSGQANHGNVSLSGGGAASGGFATSSAASAPPTGAARAAATSVADVAMQQAMASQAMQNAGRVLRRGATEIRVYVQANPYSVTLMSFFGGCLLILTSALTLLNFFGLLGSPLTYILQGYQVFFGLLIVIVDGPADRLPTFLSSKLLHFTVFLQSRVSRVLFYLFLACQQASQPAMFNTLVGYYFAAVAVGYALVHYTSPTGDAMEGTQTSLAAAAH